MCLYTKHKEPIVAQRNIKVYKHVCDYKPQTKKAKSPCQRTWFSLDEDFNPEKQTVDIEEAHSGLYEINGGVIHACLWPDFSRGKCLEAYIPAGTEYWIGIDHSTICARKLVVLNKPVTRDDNPGLDPTMAQMLYDVAIECDGVKVGDYLVTSENGYEVYRSPLQVLNLPKDSIKGIVVGFNGNTPIVADIFHTIVDTVWIDAYYRSNLGGEFFDSGDQAELDMNGYEHFTAWKKTCEGTRDRFKAYHVVKERGEDYYIPALGEMKQLITNILSVAASCSLAGLFCPICMDGYYWTSTESSEDCSWFCALCSDGWYRNWYSKYYHFRIVPFYSSAKLKAKKN